MLRAGGTSFDAEEYLAGSPFRDATRYHRGDPRWPGSAAAHRTSGFSVPVGSAGNADLGAQVEEAVAFLDLHEDELRRLGRIDGVEEVELEFAIEWHDLAVQSEYLPPELLWRAGALDIALRVTHYLARQQES